VTRKPAAHRSLSHKYQFVFNSNNPLERKLLCAFVDKNKAFSFLLLNIGAQAIYKSIDGLG
jgi:hypothetical protein